MSRLLHHSIVDSRLQSITIPQPLLFKKASTFTPYSAVKHNRVQIVKYHPIPVKFMVNLYNEKYGAGIHMPTIGFWKTMPLSMIRVLFTLDTRKKYFHKFGRLS